MEQKMASVLFKIYYVSLLSEEVFEVCLLSSLPYYILEITLDG